MPDIAISDTSDLVVPKLKSEIENARENADLIIEESIAVQAAIRSNMPYDNPSHLGADYDDGYAQGRKDAARILMLSFDPNYRGPQSAA
jgi:hypothetical protein